MTCICSVHHSSEYYNLTSVSVTHTLSRHLAVEKLFAVVDMPKSGSYSLDGIADKGYNHMGFWVCEVYEHRLISLKTGNVLRSILSRSCLPKSWKWKQLQWNFCTPFARRRGHRFVFNDMLSCGWSLFPINLVTVVTWSELFNNFLKVSVVCDSDLPNERREGCLLSSCAGGTL